MQKKHKNLHIYLLNRKKNSNFAAVFTKYSKITLN